jgi:hypothetical protein
MINPAFLHLLKIRYSLRLLYFFFPVEGGNLEVRNIVLPRPVAGFAGFVRGLCGENEMEKKKAESRDC